MPGGDRTGPRGEGPKTGWGLGLCEGNDQPGYASPRPFGRMGRGFRAGGRGFGGRGWRNRQYGPGWPEWSRARFTVPPMSQDQDIDSLKAQAQELKDRLQEVQTRLDGLEE